MDTGTHKTLMQAGSFIQAVEERQALKICCVEEIAYRIGYIGDEQLERLAGPLSKSSYGKFLLGSLKDRR